MSFDQNSVPAQRGSQPLVVQLVNLLNHFRTSYNPATVFDNRATTLKSTWNIIYNQFYFWQDIYSSWAKQNIPSKN